MEKLISIVRIALIALFLAATGVAVAWAFPYSINCVPTTDTYGAGNLALEYSNLGYPKMMRGESFDWLMAQYGIGPNIEVGVDRASDDSTSTTYLNAKWRFLSEKGTMPSLAVGTMDVTRDGKPSLYSIATKSFGKLRGHAGYFEGSYAHGIVAGTDIQVNSKWWFGADYIPGSANYTRFGVAYNITPVTYATFGVGVPNDRGVCETEYGITISTIINLGRSNKGASE